MLLFSQRPTHHSRIGNSLHWMSKFNGTLISKNFDFCFPWAVENFKSYFTDDNSWVNMPNYTDLLFQKYFKCDLTAANLYDQSRLLEARYESENNLSAFEWKCINTTFFDGDILFLSGFFNINDVLENVASGFYKLIIINEPFKLTYDPEMAALQRCWIGLEPRADLINQQASFVNSISMQNRKIGLHIRRGDYADWNCGRYFFSDDYWFELIKSIDRVTSVIFIFSNEIDSSFKCKLIQLGCVISDGDADIDFIRLMFMDEIYGPPSSYSRLAFDISRSVLNNRPLIHVMDGSV